MSEPAKSRKVALLGSRQGLAALRRSLARSGRDVVLELEPGQPNNRGALAELATKAESISEVVVLRASDAFESVEALVGTLKRLDELGIDFASVEEPWLSVRSGHQSTADDLPALSRRVARFLDLSIERLEAERRADAEQGRRDEMRAEVGKVIAQLLVLGPYAVVVALVSQSVLNAALLDPDLLMRRIRDLVTGSTAVSGAVTSAIPDALRGVVFSALGSLLLVIFRGTSIGLRADLGGAVFMGLVTVSIYGLTAGFGTGIAGALIAIPGLVLAAVLTYEFTHMVLRITAAPRTKSSSSAARGWVAWPRRLLVSVGRWADPTRSVTATALFVGIPLAAVLVSIGAAFTSGGVLFLPARAALFALVGWGIWACLATPGAVRLPLWSTLAWGALLLLLSAATTVTAVFGTVIILLLAGMVFELVFRHGDSAEATS